VDHAWRINFDDENEDESIEFSHNKDFTDIMFYNATENIYDLETFKVYPNPFSHSINLPFYLKSNSGVNISLYNNIGKKIFEVSKGSISKGQYSYNLKDLDNLKNGIYFLKILTKKGNVINKTLIKQ